MLIPCIFCLQPSTGSTKEEVALKGTVGAIIRSIFFEELWRFLGISGTYQGKRPLYKTLSNELVIVAEF